MSDFVYTIPTDLPGAGKAVFTFFALYVACYYSAITYCFHYFLPYAVTREGRNNFGKHFNKCTSDSGKYPIWQRTLNELKCNSAFP